RQRHAGDKFARPQAREFLAPRRFAFEEAHSSGAAAAGAAFRKYSGQSLPSTPPTHGFVPPAPRFSWRKGRQPPPPATRESAAPTAPLLPGLSCCKTASKRAASAFPWRHGLAP